MNYWNEYMRIDTIRAIKTMGAELCKLAPCVRKMVILIALRESRYQYTWSNFAEEHEVPKAEWPRYIHETKRTEDW